MRVRSQFKYKKMLEHWSRWRPLIVRTCAAVWSYSRTACRRSWSVEVPKGFFEHDRSEYCWSTAAIELTRTAEGRSLALRLPEAGSSEDWRVRIGVQDHVVFIRMVLETSAPDQLRSPRHLNRALSLAPHRPSIARWSIDDNQIVIEVSLTIAADEPNTALTAAPPLQVSRLPAKRHRKIGLGRP